MKKRSSIFAFAIFLAASLPAAAQNLGDRLYKEVAVDGKTLYRWVDYYSLDEYDSKGNEIHYKSSSGYEKWYEYDSRGNQIHYKSSSGYEEWYEYDSRGNKIHYKNSDGYEYWNEYDFYADGKVKTCRTYKRF